jgi:DNA repair exonuclease SbcCD ATPase subunit
MGLILFLQIHCIQANRNRTPSSKAQKEPNMKPSWKAAVSLLALGTAILLAQSSRKGEEHEQNGIDDQSYAIVSGDSLTMNGSSSDARRARMLRGRVQGDYIWFERDLKFYYITDAALVARAKELFRPQEELGRRQAELGEQQAKLGEQQAKLGEEQSRVAVHGNFSAQMEDLKRQIEVLQKQEATHKEYTEDDLGELQGKVGDLQGRIGDLQAKAGEEQGRLGEQQGKLGEEQGKLGEQQGKLGEEQGRLAEIAYGKMKTLLDHAISEGLARPVN